MPIINESLIDIFCQGYILDDINPDQVVAMGSALQDYNLNHKDSELNSTLTNQAYQILTKPVKRAIYILQLQGIDIDNDECHIKPTNAILMDIMEIREEIAESEERPEEIRQIKQRIKKDIKNKLLEVKETLEQKKYEIAAQKLIEIRYLDKIISDLKS
jgi:molecular chaperone HscB